METNFNFKSQICTSQEQGERLLALGLKKETADCYLVVEKEEVTVVAKPYYEIIEDLNGLSFDSEIIPAWSLHRLIEMMPISLPCEKMQGLEGLFSITWHQDKTFTIGYVWSMEKCGNLYDAMVDAIERLIKEGYFNKEYLEE